jgi:SAM-dependent methyltransferase
MGCVPIRTPHVVEVGCGSGLLQVQIENLLGVAVDGFDLNEEALKRNTARLGALYLYDIQRRHLAFEQHYNTLFLFDVLEHIEEEGAFFDAVLFHLSRNGLLFLNVPALSVLFSRYDVAVGHVRRYNARDLGRLARRHGVEIVEWTYWGLALLPVVYLRKVMPAGRSNQEITRRGFDPQGRPVNEVLMLLARCEWIPQKLCGTSLMAVMRRV